MLSIILYGRNDNYGYNLHKRTAISLNCMAEVLSDADDEIIFVDCNTPDDMPTFPEAIQDTLTFKAKEKLRILRIRPEVFKRHMHKTHHVVLESQSRNVAARYSNPKNRWLLSTNSDIVFTPRDPALSLSRIVANIPDGFYELPRFEIPETLWESIDRQDARGNIEKIRQWGVDFRLNLVVESNPFARFDGPGDFQLMLREQFFAIHGFDEEMVFGWHNDSNMCKRLNLLNGTTESLLDHVYVYHCDHTRLTTKGHGPDHIENDSQRFVFDVDSPYLPGQAETWGLVGENIEESRLLEEKKSLYELSLQSLIKGYNKPHETVKMTERSFNQCLIYDNSHVFPFLADHLVSLPADTIIGYVGCNTPMLQMIAKYRNSLQHSGKILYYDPFIEYNDPTLKRELPTSCSARALDQIAQEASLILFDAGMMCFSSVKNALGYPTPAGTSESIGFAQEFLQAFLFFSIWEKHHITNLQLTPRKFLLVGVVDTFLGASAKDIIGTILTPNSSNVRHGFIREKAFETSFVLYGIHYLLLEFRPQALSPWFSEILQRDVSVEEVKQRWILHDELIDTFVNKPTRFNRGDFNRLLQQTPLLDVDIAFVALRNHCCRIDYDLAGIDLFGRIVPEKFGMNRLPTFASIWERVDQWFTKNLPPTRLEKLAALHEILPQLTLPEALLRLLNRTDILTALFQSRSEINTQFIQNLREINLDSLPAALAGTLREGFSALIDYAEDVLRISPAQSIGEIKTLPEGKTTITIFALPKAFKGEAGRLQTNAIKSWMALRPTPEIILFGEDEGTAEFAEMHGIRHHPKIAKSEFGTPLLSSIFNQAQAIASNKIVAYVNADMILMSDFAWAVEQSVHHFKDFLLVGQRFNLDVNDSIDFNDPTWEERFYKAAAPAVEAGDLSAVDYFVFNKGLFSNYPAFAVGKLRWDDWMVYQALAKDAAVINASQAVLAIHQNHLITLLPEGKGDMRWGIEPHRNLLLAGGWEHIFNIQDANWMLNHNGLHFSGSKRIELLRQKEQGLLLHKEGNLPAAESIYREVLAQEPNDHETLNRLGKLFFETRRFQEAIEILNHALQVRSDNPDTFSLIAQIAATFNNKDTFEKAYQKIFELNPRHPEGAVLRRLYTQVNPQAKSMLACPFCGGFFKKMLPEIIIQRDAQGTEKPLPIPNALCPACGSNPRQRLFLSFLEENSQLFDPDHHMRLLHLEPDYPLYNLLINRTTLDYDPCSTGKGHLPHAWWIDLHKIEYAEDTFDIILLDQNINFLDFDNDQQDEILRVLKRNGMIFWLTAENKETTLQVTACKKEGKCRVNQHAPAQYLDLNTFKLYPQKYSVFSFRKQLSEQLQDATAQKTSPEPRAVLPVLPEYQKFDPSQPKISVVVIAFNQADFLQETVASIFAQTLVPYEIIIQDGGSTDQRTWELIQDLERQFPGWIKIGQDDQNYGVAHTRNQGLKKATGDWITWIDGDDLFTADKLSAEWAAIQKFPGTKIAYSNVIVIDETGRQISMWNKSQRIPLASGDIFMPVCARQLFPDWHVEFRNPLVHRSVFDKIGYFDEVFWKKNRMYEDWDWTIRAAAVYPVIYSSAAAIKYRIHSANLSKRKGKEHATAIRAVIEKNKTLIEQRPHEDQILIQEGLERAIEIFLDRWEQIGGAYG